MRVREKPRKGGGLCFVLAIEGWELYLKEEVNHD
jgi:hypothetical protein